MPSFTEAHPQVVLESLSRRRPVIIFDEISHIIGEKKGIFVSKRKWTIFFNNNKTYYGKLYEHSRKHGQK